jgi:osmoprotectant transport system substrate-binding protein
MRSFSSRRASRLGLVVVAVVAAACSSGSKSSSSSGSSSTATGSSSAGGSTIASQLTLGGPPECQQNTYCLPGLKRVYGITFKSFKSLDADGPLTYQAITHGDVDVAEVFSTDAQVVADNLVVLNDDKHLQAADAVVPVIRNAKNPPTLTGVVDKVSATLTTDILRTLNAKVGVDKQDPQTVADQWLASTGLNAKSGNAAGVSLTLAGANFPENTLLAYVYGDALKAAGANVTIKPNLGTRATLEPGLQSGQIDMLIEYAASDLEYLDKSAGLANGDIANNVDHLKTIYQPMGISVLQASTAIDTNAFAVKQATATKYHLVNMSDLAKAA